MNWTRFSIVRGRIVDREEFTARGTETRPQLNSRSPFTSLSANYRDPYIRLLVLAREGDMVALQTLADAYASYIEGVAKTNNWRIAIKDYNRLALDILHEYTADEPVSMRKIAMGQGINEKSYRENWTGKMEIVRAWITNRVR